MIFLMEMSKIQPPPPSLSSNVTIKFILKICKS